jgi:quercetin dioxygenase-like cupin family protein
MLRIVTTLLLALTTSPALAQRAPDAPAANAPTKAVPEAKAPANAAGYPAVPLLSTSTTILGEPLRYPTGQPHVNASIITLAPGQRTIPHKHGVPLFAYILDGELSVDYGAKGVRTYKKGDSFMEAMDTVHYGFNPGKEPVRLLAVYMGAKGAQDVEPVK